MSYSIEFHRRMKRLSKQQTAPAGGVIDMHLHLVDFLEETEGLPVLLDAMNHARVTQTVIFGLPVKKKWAYYEPEKPGYYLDDNARCYYFASTDEIVAEQYSKLAPDQQERFAPTINGFNPTDKLAVDYLEHIYNKYDFWRGVGEVLLRHDDLTNLTNEETARANHPAMMDIYRFCEEKSLPINLHQNVTSVGDNADYKYLHELKHVLENFSKSPILWAHCGVSRRVTHKQYTDMLRPLLLHHNNLFVDLSWVVYDDVVCDPDYTPKHTWVELIEEYADRFMIGSDTCGHFEAYGQTMARYNSLFDALKESTVEKVARGNASGLWFE
jgi:predicted TIM-barrel fold metal-dependent hydrolase